MKILRRQLGWPGGQWGLLLLAALLAAGAQAQPRQFKPLGLRRQDSLRLDTVRSYIRQIYRKLQVNSKTEVIAKAWHF